MAEQGIHFPLVPTCEEGRGTIVASILLREPDTLPIKVGAIRIGKSLPENVPAMLEDLIRRLPTEQRKYVGAIALDRLCEEQTHNNRGVAESVGVVAFCGETALKADYRQNGRQRVVNGFGKAYINLEGAGSVWPVIYPQLDPRLELRNPYKYVVQAGAVPDENGLWIALRDVQAEMTLRPLPIMLEAA